MTRTSPTTPPPVDPVLQAFEKLSAKMDQFNTTLEGVRDLLMEDRVRLTKLEDRVSALENIPPPSSKANGAHG